MLMYCFRAVEIKLGTCTNLLHKPPAFLPGARPYYSGVGGLSTQDSWAQKISSISPAFLPGARSTSLMYCLMYYSGCRDQTQSPFHCRDQTRAEKFLLHKPPAFLPGEPRYLHRGGGSAREHRRPKNFTSIPPAFLPGARWPRLMYCVRAVEIKLGALFFC